MKQLKPIKFTKARGKELLKLIQKEILAEPDRLDMDLWYGDAKDDTERNPGCGTVGCIAGWAVLLTEKKPRNHTTKRGHESFIDNMPGGFDIQGVACERLGLTGMQAATLFHTESWPDEYREAYEATDSKAERAFIVAARIQRVIDES